MPPTRARRQTPTSTSTPPPPALRVGRPGDRSLASIPGGCPEEHSSRRVADAGVGKLPMPNMGSGRRPQDASRWLGLAGASYVDRPAPGTRSATLMASSVSSPVCFRASRWKPRTFVGSSPPRSVLGTGSGRETRTSSLPRRLCTRRITTSRTRLLDAVRPTGFFEDRPLFGSMLLLRHGLW